MLGKSWVLKGMWGRMRWGGWEGVGRNVRGERGVRVEDMKRRRDLEKELGGEGEKWGMELVGVGEKKRRESGDGKMVNGKMKKIDCGGVVDGMEKV